MPSQHVFYVAKGSAPNATNKILAIWLAPYFMRDPGFSFSGHSYFQFIPRFILLMADLDTPYNFASVLSDLLSFLIAFTIS